MKKSTEKAKKNNLDERQEQTLLKIESRGFWLAFWLLITVILIQTALQSTDLLDWLPPAGGEWLVFFVLCIYVMVRSHKNNIWDRKLQPKFSTNLLMSLGAGAAMAVVSFVIVYLPTKDVTDSLIGAACGFVGTAVLCIIALSISAAAYKRKRARLEADEEAGCEE